MAEFVYFARTGRDLRARPAEKNAPEGTAPRRSFKLFNFSWGGFKPVYLTCRNLGFSLRGVPPHQLNHTTHHLSFAPFGLW